MIGRRSGTFKKALVPKPGSSGDDDDDYFEATKPPRLVKTAAVKKSSSPLLKSKSKTSEKTTEKSPVTKPLPSVMKLAALAKKVKKLDEEEDEAVHTDEEAEEGSHSEDYVDLPGRMERRRLALKNSELLGMPSFETERPVRYEVMKDEDEENDKRYENARSNDTKIAEASELPDGDKRRVRGLTTLFGQRSDAILNLLDKDDQTDGALTLINRTLLQTLVDVLPVVERSVRRSRGKRGIIPFNQLISQVRELVTDIQALRDKGQLGASVVERVVRPAYLDLASQIVQAFMEIEANARSRMTPEDFQTYRDTVLIVTKRSLAQYINSQYEDMKNDVISQLS